MDFFVAEDIAKIFRATVLGPAEGSRLQDCGPGPSVMAGPPPGQDLSILAVQLFTRIPVHVRHLCGINCPLSLFPLTEVWSIFRMCQQISTAIKCWERREDIPPFFITISSPPFPLYVIIYFVNLQNQLLQNTFKIPRIYHDRIVW